MVDQQQRIGDRSLRLRSDISVREMQAMLSEKAMPRLPPVNRNALSGLKFSSALPPDLASRTVAERLADLPSAETVLGENRVFMTWSRLS